MNKRVLIIYHRVDGDGICSCLVAKKYYQQERCAVDIFGFNYKDTIPDISTFLRTYDEICMVDISFPADIMQDLCQSARCIWIDHHITAINDSITYGYSQMQGRREVGRAACEIAWEYFNPGVQMPELVHLSGVYDTWRKTEVSWDGIIMPFQYAMRTNYGINPAAWEKDWEILIDPSNERLKSLISEGHVILKYLHETWQGWVKGYAFPVTVAGQYKGICMITPMGGSSCFESVMNDYDLYITTNRKEDENGNVYFSVSMYKEPDRLPEFNCGEYLKSKFPGAGGHASAAGGSMGLEDWERLVCGKEI